MLLVLDRSHSLPLYRQLSQQVKELIENGTLAPGSRLPTVRKLAEDHGLTRLTVQTAFAELQDQGWIQSTVGRGTFVSESQTPTPPQSRLEIPGALAELLRAGGRPARFHLAQAAPSEEFFPKREWKASLMAALQQEGSLHYGTIQGDENLRSQISRVLMQRGLQIPPEQILITHGAQQGMDLAARTLSRPNQPVLLETPCYPGALELLHTLSRPCLEVPIESGGPNLKILEEHCRRHRPSLLYTVPTFQNPTGLLTSPAHRQALLQLAQRYDFWILEDDVWGFLNYTPSLPPPLKAQDKNQRVIYISSFSKTLMPALRLGFVVASEQVLQALCQKKHASDLVCSLLLQRGLAEYLKRGHFGPHLQRIVPLYKQRRDALHQGLQQHLPQCQFSLPPGGLSHWLQLPAGVDEQQFYNEACENGLICSRGEAFYPTPRFGHLRLSFGAHPPAELLQAAALLGQLLQAQQRKASLMRERARLRANPLV